MSMLKDEISVLKSVMMRLDESTAMLVTYQYHTEINECSKVDRSKSRYRYMARVFKTEDLVKTIQSMREDVNRLTKARWPDDPWPWYICTEYPENWRVADWLATKLKKIKTWEEGQKILLGYKNPTKTRMGGINEKARYEIDGYEDKDGNLVSLSDKAALLKLVGQNLMKVNKKSV